jgi:serine/threonine protein kinase
MSAPRIGDKIRNQENSYVIEGILGSGTFGKVYRALNEYNNQHVAIKYMLTYVDEFGRVYDPRQETEHEFTAYTIFSKKPDCSPYIVCLYDGFSQNKSYYLVYELMQGDITKFIPKDIQTLYKLMFDTITGLETMHARFYAHRDIKTANILYNKDHFKFGDLGMLCYRPNCSVSGTPYFMDPTFYIKFQNHDPNITWDEARVNDIWGLGVVLFDMVIKFMLAHNIDRKNYYYMSDVDVYFPYNIAAGLPYTVIKSPFVAPNNISPKWNVIINTILDTMLNPNPALRSNATDLVNYLTRSNMCSINNKDLPKADILKALFSYSQLVTNPIPYSDTEDTVSLCDKLALTMDRVPAQTCVIKSKEFGDREVNNLLNILGFKIKGNFSDKCTKLQKIFNVSNNHQRQKFTQMIVKTIYNLSKMAVAYPHEVASSITPKYTQLMNLINSTGNPRELLSITVLKAELDKWIILRDVSRPDERPIYNLAIKTVKGIINDLEKVSLPSTGESMDISDENQRNSVPLERMEID